MEKIKLMKFRYLANFVKLYTYLNIVNCTASAG